MSSRNGLVSWVLAGCVSHNHIRSRRALIIGYYIIFGGENCVDVTRSTLRRGQLFVITPK